MLDTPNSDIAMVGGPSFQHFLQKDSIALWNDIKKKDSRARREDHWVTICAVDKYHTKSSATCPDKISGNYTKQISYIPQSLDTIIAEMVAGKAVRQHYRSFYGKPKRLAQVYYGLGDTADRFLGKLARDRGYATISLIREAQMSISSNAIIGNELIHLFEPVVSQTMLVRMDPSKRPITPFLTNKPNLAYLRDQGIAPIDPMYIDKGVYEGYGEQDIANIDVLVKYR